MKFPVIFKKAASEQFGNAIKTAKENHKKLYEYEKLFTHFCPFCGAPLEATDRVEPLETLDEHVSCSHVTKKTVYKCSAHCEDSKYTMWNYNGESYSDFPKDLSEDEWKIEYDKNYEIKKRVFGTTIDYCGEALGSHVCSIECSSSAPGMKKDYRIKLFKNQKYIPVIKKNYHFNEFAEPEYFTLSLEYLVKDGSHYIVKTSLTSQISYLIHSTKHAYKAWMKNPSERHLKQLYGISRFFKSPDERKGIDKIYYKYVIPFVFGKIMGIKLPKD